MQIIHSNNVGTAHYKILNFFRVSYKFDLNFRVFKATGPNSGFLGSVGHPALEDQSFSDVTLILQMFTNGTNFRACLICKKVPLQSDRNLVGFISKILSLAKMTIETVLCHVFEYFTGLNWSVISTK